MRLPLYLCLLFPFLLLSACEPHEPLPESPDAGVNPADLVPTLLDVELDSDGQSSTVGTALAQPLAVRVVNRKEQPLAGVEVKWELAEGTGTLDATATSTDTEGRARVALTLGTEAGVRRVKATVAGLEPAVLTARGLPGPVAQVVVTTQASTLEVERTLKLEVALADAHGNTVSGQAVTWASSDEGTAVVDVDGTVRGVATGPVRLTATSGGVSGHVDLEVVWPTNAVVFTSVAAGHRHACATLRSGGAWCWGADNNGALGNGATDTTVKKTPSPVSGPEGVRFTRVKARGDGACALAEDGAAWCWGRNNYGQLGDGTTTTRHEPVAVRMPEGVRFDMLTLSRTHACGLTADGEGWCWGRNVDGGLGDGTTTNSSVPVRVSTPEGVTGLRALSSGSAFTCGVSAEGEVYCWGTNGVGQLGDGTTTSHPTPEKVSTPVGVHFDAVHAANDYACAASREGELYCWGKNTGGQLGDGTTTNASVPVKVSTPEGVGFAALAGDIDRTCALTKTEGEVYCWGKNPSGQLGDGTQADAAVPVKALLPAGVRAASLSAGTLVTCATTTAGEAFCWGENLNGLLGNGSDALNATTPMKVTEPVAQ